MAEHLAIEEIVEEYLLARDRGDADALERLVALYPEHEHGLTRYALLDAAVSTRPPLTTVLAAQALLTPALKAQAIAAALNIVEPVQPIVGIIARAQELRVSARDLAVAVDLPRDVLLQLDRRLIAATSLPRTLLTRLCNALQTSADSLSAFLVGAGPAGPVAAYHYAPEQPRSGEVVSFAEALAASALVTDEQRAAWEQALREEGLA